MNKKSLVKKKFKLLKIEKELKPKLFKTNNKNIRVTIIQV
jgi:hypothetical protein